MSFYTAMENAMAHMIFYMNRNQKTDVSALAGYLNCLPESLKIDGDIQEQKNFIIFTVSPAYSQDRQNHSGFDGMISCDAYIYHLLKGGEEKSACGLKITRMDIGFRKNGDEGRIESVFWYTVQDMEPWSYRGKITEPETAGIGDGFGAETTSGSLSSEDYLVIKKQVNRPWDQLAISSDEELRRMFCVPGGIEQPDLGSLIGLTSSPAMEITGRNQIQVWYPVELFGIHGNMEGHPSVCRCFYYVNSLFSKDEGKWQMTGQKGWPVLRLPDTPYPQGQRYDKISVDMFPWTLGNEELPGIFEEDSYKIENIINAWVYGCRRGRLCEFYENYMKNDGFVPEMLIRSRGAQTPKLHGEDEILHKLSGMDARYHPGMYTFHTATTPLIEISVDGRTAVGTWFDHSATNLSGSAFEDSKIPYMVFVARYRHHFRKIDGKWFLTDFFWEPLISLKDWSFDRKHSGGLAARKNAVLYPEAFSSDIYSCK
ncbi:hypothetical protein HNP82_002081 [Catenibacillus scindens]|uniref:SnoaL-like domain-containing protein n=1 Tax=Catenibacillus scindens TaxID=673271 RepID=A0A7W8HC33_9FIRM|nr:nuclear transport factor 2 family protein [Catenibacillus scindens]MBB5264942.1 hypothetical protein [Catenibacillus scindens]